MSLAEIHAKGTVFIVVPVVIVTVLAVVIAVAVVIIAAMLFLSWNIEPGCRGVNSQGRSQGRSKEQSVEKISVIAVQVFSSVLRNLRLGGISGTPKVCVRLKREDVLNRTSVGGPEIR